MQSHIVKKLMIPLSDYATVKEDASLFDAVLALEESQKKSAGKKYPHMAVLVLNAAGLVIGKIDQRDVLKGLEPKYRDLDHYTAMQSWGFSPHFIRSMIDKSGLFSDPLDRLCQKAADIHVLDLMRPLSEDQQIGEEDTLDLAIHKFVMSNLLSLLVARGQEIIGVLRRCDIFEEVCSAIKKCNL